MSTGTENNLILRIGEELSNDKTYISCPGKKNKVIFVIDRDVLRYLGQG